MTIRMANGKDVIRIVDLSIETRKELSKKGDRNFFEGVESYEVYMALKKPSTVFIVEQRGEVIAFALMRIPTDEEKHEYIEEFGESLIEDSVILDGYAVKPKLWGRKIATMMLDTAKYWAKKNGHRTILGIVHPENYASIRSVGRMGKTSFGSTFVHEGKDGDSYKRKLFVTKLGNS